jgi:hypothetical protein
MRAVIRHIISLAVSLIITVVAAQLATVDHLILFSLVPLYSAATSMLLAHKQQWLSFADSNRSGRKRGAIIGGVGAFTGSLLLQASIPAGFAGYGLMILGMAGGIAYLDES